MTALQIAVDLNYTQFVEKLLNVSGIELDPKTDYGKGGTPFYFAALNGYVEILKLLHAAGADIHDMHGNGLMPIHIAAFNGDLPAVKTFIEAGKMWMLLLTIISLLLSYRLLSWVILKLLSIW